MLPVLLRLGTATSLSSALVQLQAYAGVAGYSPAEAAALSSRLELVEKLTRRFRVRGSSELLGLAEAWSDQLEQYYDTLGAPGGGRWGAADDYIHQYVYVRKWTETGLVMLVRGLERAAVQWWPAGSWPCGVDMTQGKQQQKLAAAAAGMKWYTPLCESDTLESAMSNKPLLPLAACVAVPCPALPLSLPLLLSGQQEVWRAEVAALQAQVTGAALQLSAARRSAAVRLSAAVQSCLSQLAMSSSRFGVDISWTPAGQAEQQVGSSRGSRVAPGGEGDRLAACCALCGTREHV